MREEVPFEVLDSSAVMRLAKLRNPAGRYLLIDLVALFARDVPTQIVACQDALASGDFEALRRAAHAAKGNAGVLGAIEFGAICARIECRAASGVVSDLSAFVQTLPAAFHRAKAALDLIDVREET